MKRAVCHSERERGSWWRGWRAARPHRSLAHARDDRRSLVLAAIFVLAATNAMSITVEQYASALDRIGALVGSNQLDAARAEAQSLTGAQVEGGFIADRALLGEVIALKRADLHVRERLAATAMDLRRSAGIAVPAQDLALLEKIKAEQSVAKPAAGGEVVSPNIANLSVWERIAEWTGKAMKWIGDLLVKFFEWLLGFWPKSKLSPNTPTFGMRWIVAAVVVLIVIVLLVLALEVIRRGQSRLELGSIESEPVSSRRDDDPLSRGANEWERYAAQLAAAGRLREAIRAWYHAVLVTLYAAGVLHFRKGRTNWEYVSALSPQVPWRGEFVTLTRHFEGQWYGADRSSSEALDEASRRARGILDSVRRGAA